MTTPVLSLDGAAAVEALRAAHRRLRATAPGAAARIDWALRLADAFAAAERVAAIDPPSSARIIEAVLELLRSELEVALSDEPAWVAHDARVAAQLVASMRLRSVRRRPPGGGRPWRGPPVGKP